jgi:hypothetical protein
MPVSCAPCAPRRARDSRASRLVALAAVLLMALALPARGQPQPVAGQNINMVSGTSWPGGDPFLQRQNEPSIAVSSRNPLHLLAGANDYRTVDLPVSDTVPGSLAGDAWLGVFKSYDGGLSWQSYLLPGYPQDQSQTGMASPLKAYSAAADPTVRAGTGGVFYYSGIAFNRGTNNGAVFVTTLFDTNQKENGAAPQGTDAVQYQYTTVVDTGTSGQFLDKTWIAVDIPRSGAGTCTFPGLTGSQTIKAGNVYLVWSRFTGSQSTKIMFSRSLDCGKTWSNPTKLSESSSINQGTNLAIDPSAGTVYAAWRQFSTSSDPDSILVARSDNFGMTFPSKNTERVATIAPFDQPMSTTRFRTNSLPSIAASVDSQGKSRVHVAWAERTGPDQEARIVVSTSSNSGKTWGAPAPVDAVPLSDDSGNSFSRGHQFMPQLTFAAGRLMVVYYDQRLDHTLSLFKPNDPFVPDAQGRFYLKTQAPRGELEGGGGANQVFTLFVDDDATILTQRRHTIDLRVAEALPSASPSFSSATVSQYRMGLFAPDETGTYRDDEDRPIDPQPPDRVQQLQVNAPNLPMFSLGTLPFLGDYIDIAGDVFQALPNGDWAFNTSAAGSPVFYATWTDNRDVVPPVDPATGLVDWTKYTPPISATNDGDGTSHSILDPTQMVPACLGAYTGSRNQNIYLSRITEGFRLASPQDSKPLSATLQRAFVVTLQNQTAQSRSFHLTIANQPPGGQASFLQGNSQTALDLTIPAGSGEARPIFATSTNPAATITVNAIETSCASCLSGSLVLNPEGSVSPLAQPDGTSVDIGSVEVYTPTFAVWNPDNNPGNPDNPNPYVNITDPNQNISNQNISNQNISNADPAIQNISNQNISNQNISNQNISNQNISNPSPAIQNISNQNISNQNISNTTAANQNISNQNISNQNISNQNISNAPYTDANYAIVNTGNTTHSYRLTLYGNNPNNVPLQLIATKNSQTPVAVGCTLQSLPQSTVLTQADGTIASSLDDATDPNISDGSTTNATVAIGPGETVFLTLRGQLTHDEMVELTRHLTPVVTAHGANTGAPASDFALLLSIQTAGGATLPAAVVGSSYSTTLQAAGGKAPLTWTLLPGSTLPDGLTLSSAGVISGTPVASGSSTFTVQVADSTAGTPQTATQSFSLTVAGRTTTTSVGFGADPIVVGQSTGVTVTVMDTEGTGAPVSPTGTVSLTGSGLSAESCVLMPGVSGTSTCSVTVTPTATGTDAIQANFPASSVHQMSGGGRGLTVNPAATAVALVSSPNPSVFGQTATFTASVSAVPPGSLTPTGSVTFSDGGSTLGTAALSAGGATFATAALTGGPHTIIAAYGGDGSFAASTSPSLSHVVNPAGTVTTLTSSLNPSAFGQSVTFTAAVASPAGVPTGTVVFLDGGASIGTGTLSGVGTASVATTALTAGVHTITAVYGGAPSFAGSTSAPLTQTVTAFYTFTGFLSPMAAAGPPEAPSFSGTDNYGSVVPIKWQLQDASGNYLTDLSTTTMLQAIAYTGGACSGQATGTAYVLYNPTTGAAGGSTFRSSSNRFIFNWDSSYVGSPGCYELELQLNDGSSLKATIEKLQ